jgi:hypothetical protein
VRKKAIKKLLPNRGRAFKVLRSKNFTREVVDRACNLVCLNFVKHLLLGKSYIHQEYQAELARFAQTQINRQEVEEAKQEEPPIEEKGEEYDRTI